MDSKKESDYRYINIDALGPSELRKRLAAREAFYERLGVAAPPLYQEDGEIKVFKQASIHRENNPQMNPLPKPDPPQEYELLKRPLIGKIVLSIPHSGTRTLTTAFNYGPRSEQRGNEVWAVDQEWTHFHVYGRIHPDFVGFAENTILAVPLREPRDIWRSWVKRWETQVGAVDLGLFIHQWEYLEEFDKEYDLFYIPLDRPERQEMLDKLSERCKEELTIDWSKKVGHIGEDVSTDHPEPDWDYIYNLPFVKRFYVT